MLVFSSLEEAVAAVDRVCSEYPQQRAWAREVAREVFDYRQVLPHMLDAAIAGGAPGNMSKRDGIDGRQTALSGTNNQTPR
jgi:hypothetical protein